MKDYAFRKVKLQSSQHLFCSRLASKGGEGTSGSIGVDFGGWQAFNKLVSGLKKRGLITVKGNVFTLVEGEPVPITEPVLGKPYIKVRRELISLFDGEALATENAQIYLDPRGEALFLILLPYVSTSHLDLRKRAIIVEGHLAAVGASCTEAINHAKAISLENVLFLTKEQARQVILIQYAAVEGVPGKLYQATELKLNYHVLIEVGTKLYHEPGDGSLKPFPKVHGTLIDWSEEREAALFTLMFQMAHLGRRLKAITESEETLLEALGTVNLRLSLEE